ncbi:ABC transporter substrate-binding protein [Paenibacillus sepulcri]|uniref:ABC transporter substrate-binding protein n=1 Tax=Paenibacillus sepulcri TaxID=359917 RepID=A0ABS7C034_9BACL|nr:ABC transporter substrate-binding protein [Paenibacillus sepulcri]
MTRTKKSVGLALALMLVVAMVLSGCGSKNNNGNTAANNGGSTNDSTAGNSGGSTEEPVNLVWYTIGAPQKDMDKVMTEVSKYTAEKIGVTVTMKMIDFGDYDQKMKVLTASGSPMDILFSCSWAFDYVQNARKGAFAPIDELLTQYGQGIVDELDPAFLEGSKVDGHNYGVPANKELPTQEVWRFNKNLVDKYNLDISNVNTLESLEPLLKTIKEKEPQVAPFAVNKDHVPVVPYDYIIQNLPMAVKLDTTDFKIVDVLETPEMKQALETMHKYYTAGYISPEAATISSTDDLTKSGKWFLDRASSQPFADILWSQSYGYPVVSKPANDSVIYNWSVMGSMQAISANSKHPDKAMQFLNLLNTDPVLRNMVDSGIEGVHYKKIDDTHMENLPDAKNYDMPTFALGNIMLTYLSAADPADKWEQFKAYNDAGKAAPTLGFNFDSSKVVNELAAIQNVKGEFWPALMTGTADPDKYLPQAIEKFKAAGLDKIIAEAQSQLDAWRATQK